VSKTFYAGGNFREGVREVMDKFGEKLKAANAVLKRGTIRVAVIRRNDRLYLRATLPPKPDAAKTEPHQQDISLKVYANPGGLKRAIAEAKRVSAAVALEQFDWEDWGHKPKVLRLTVAQWTQQFEKQYFTDRQRNGGSETTWHKDFYLPFNQLPQGDLLTEELMLKVIEQKAPNSRSRLRFCDAYRALAEFAGVPLKLGKLRGNYSPTKVSTRNLPAFELIKEWHDRIPDESWQWFYGVMAAYGLRSHEIFYIDLASIKESALITVTDGKTGAHFGLPCPAGLWEEWRLYDTKVPFITARTVVDQFGNESKRNEDYTNKAGQYFRRDMTPETLPFHLQDLRHCWSIRASRFMPEAYAAKLQGHSQKMHNEVYQQHTNESTFLEVLQSMQGKS